MWLDIPMFIKRFFEPKLAQTSYLIVCQGKGQAVVIDPNRDVDQYIQAAAAEGAKITHITETHIHADFCSGARELAARSGGTLYLSDEGDADWKYAFAGSDGAVLVKNGDHLTVGNIDLEVLHTPGHTPEHISFLITDGAAANEPIAAATGDFIFVGDVGRPDLLEKAANMKGTMEVGARVLWHSIEAFRARPDWLQIWPGHGAGSACGKGISAIPHSTLGYEKRFNWAFQCKTEQEFVDNVLAGQPDPPRYFAEMKRLNKVGPRVLGGFTRPRQRRASDIGVLLADGARIFDMRPAAEFAAGAVPGTISVPMNGSFTTWMGWFAPYTEDFFVIGDAATVDMAVRDLAMIGLDRVAGWFDPDVIDLWASSASHPLTQIPQIAVEDLTESLKNNGVTLIDVRNASEWAAGHIAGARHIPLGRLLERIDEIPLSKPIVIQCAAGARSMIGASLLKTRGVDRVINLTGGFGAWANAGLPVAD
jgi:hydroxyacylglutathione hydrolase